MKHAIFCVMGAALLLTAAWGCRKESDALTAYDYDESLVFEAAKTSFAAKFDIIWNGMNQYYALWDYEAEQGLDWDAVYDTYYPKFQALDQRGEDQTVTDEELSALLEEVLGSFHDGHFNIDVLNHKTGTTVNCHPSLKSFNSRDDWKAAVSTPLNLGYYANPANGEVETDADGNPIAEVCKTSVSFLLSRNLQTPGMGGYWMMARIEELEALPSLSDYEAFELQNLNDLKLELRTLNGKSDKQALAIYNQLQAKYSFLGIPGFDYIDPAFAKNGLEIKYALLKGNIAYLGFNHFNLGAYLDDNESEEEFDMSNPLTRQLVVGARAIWQGWFDGIQTLHKAGKLGGVIIDVRGNTGGSVTDSRFVAGALAPGRYIHFGYQRFKRGTGRYEYSPLMEARLGNMSQPHEDVTDVPIAVLTNCASVSMAESTALSVKTLPKGKVIGKRSFGAICALCTNDLSSYNYSGYIGVEGVTPVFGCVPAMASFTLDKRIIESEGVTPDIEVDLDVAQFQATGRDTQLDRALQYIRDGQ